MIELAGGIGAFHVTCGDIVDPGEIRKVIDNSCGTNLPMFHVVGNHDTYWPQSTAWMREEFETGHGRRTPLSRLVARSGPPGCRETTYSWDFGNAHLVVLNEYWNGTTNSGSDTATNGSIEPELLEWLRADLAGTDKPLVFVFGHEPAFVPEGMRHRGDSLDAYPEQMENFCALLEREGVTAYINGHTHVSYQVQIKGVWHINVGTAGSRTHGQGPTFVSIDVGSRAATVSNWTVTGLTPRWTLKDRITLNSRRPVATTPPGTPP
jgi:predicted phosphodiesterase